MGGRATEGGRAEAKEEQRECAKRRVHSAKIPIDSGDDASPGGASDNGAPWTRRLARDAQSILLPSCRFRRMRDTLQDPVITAALVREAPDIIATFDHAGRLLQANPATVRQSGYSLEELQDLPMSAFFDAADLARLSAARDRTAAGEQVTATVRYRHKDGQIRWLSARTAPLLREGADYAMLVFARDVTDEVVRNQSLRASDERFRSLVAAFDRAFFVVDPDLRLAGLFGRWVETAGVDPRRLLGRTPVQLAPQTGGEPHLSAMKRTMAGEDVTYECDFPAPSGELRRLRVSLSPMRDADGGVTGIAGVAADVTRRIRADAEAGALRARIVESERAEALGKLVSGVAHELNNPLAAVLNFTEDLLDTEPDPDRRAALEVVRAQALRSRTIVRDLLTFARRGGHRPLAPQEPGPIIESVVRAIRPGLGRGVSLVWEITQGATSLELDRAGFEQVITNLITNAAHASPRDGEVRLHACRVGAEFVIDVVDDGPGIPADFLPRIFEPFFTTKATGQGVGLGLSVSLGIVAEHKGTLEARNRVDGAGACFTVRLPVSRRAAIPPTPPIGIALVSGSVPTLSADAPGLLIIDDEEPIRRALRRFFERRGWRVEEAVDGFAGLEKLVTPGAERHYAAVLCDLRMPGLDGPQLYAKVRELAPAMLSRIVISTGDTSTESAAAFLGGIDAHILEKPYELSAVASLLDQLRTRHSNDA